MLVTHRSEDVDKNIIKNASFSEDILKGREGLSTICHNHAAKLE